MWEATLNLGHIALIPVFLSRNIFLKWFFRWNCLKFEANIERGMEKEVEDHMSTLFIQLTQVLMSQIVALMWL